MILGWVWLLDWSTTSLYKVKSWEFNVPPSLTYWSVHVYAGGWGFGWEAKRIIVMNILPDFVIHMFMIQTRYKIWAKILCFFRKQVTDGGMYKMNEPMYSNGKGSRTLWLRRWGLSWNEPLGKLSSFLWAPSEVSPRCVNRLIHSRGRSSITQEHRSPGSWNPSHSWRYPFNTHLVSV